MWLWIGLTRDLKRSEIIRQEYWIVWCTDLRLCREHRRQGLQGEGCNVSPFTWSALILACNLLCSTVSNASYWADLINFSFIFTDTVAPSSPTLALIAVFHKVMHTIWFFSFLRRLQHQVEAFPLFWSDYGLGCSQQEVLWIRWCWKFLNYFSKKKSSNFLSSFTFLFHDAQHLFTLHTLHYLYWVYEIEEIVFLMSTYSSNTLAGLTLGSVSASECEFLAKETLIEISPKFSHPKLKFISVMIMKTLLSFHFVASECCFVLDDDFA